MEQWFLARNGAPRKILKRFFYAVDISKGNPGLDDGQRAAGKADPGKHSGQLHIFFVMKIDHGNDIPRFYLMQEAIQLLFPVLG